MNTAQRLKAAREQRDEARAALAAIEKAANAENRSTLTPKEKVEEQRARDQFEAADAEMDRLVRSIENEERAVEFESRLGDAVYQPGSGQEEKRGDMLLPMSEVEMRAITSGAVGAAIIPPDRTRQVFTEIRRRSPLLGLMSHFSTDRLTFNVPRVSVGVEAGIVAESSLIPEADPVAETSEVTLRKSGIRTITSIEAWRSSDPSVGDLLASEHVRAHQRAATRLALLGTGAGEPQGVIGHPSVNDTSNGSTAADLDDIHALVARLIAKGLEVDEIALVMAPDLFAQIERHKDGDGRYLLSAPGAATERRIFGARVILDEHIPTDGGTGTNETVVAAGAWKYAAYVTNTSDAVVEASADAGWANGDVHVRSMFFWGTKVIDPAAFETLSAVTV